MKRKWFLPVLAAGLLLLAAMALFRRPVEDQLPPMAMVEGRLYQLSAQLEAHPDVQPDGTLREIIGNEVPRQEGQANFGEAGMPYWVLNEGLCVYVEETGKILLFEETDIQE